MRDLRPKVVESVHLTAIWKEEWKKAQPGKHEIRDGKGQRWEVLENNGVATDGEQQWVLTLRHVPTYGDQGVRFVYTMDTLKRKAILLQSTRNPHHVLDHYFNHPNALVIDLEAERQEAERRPDELYGRPFIADELLFVNPEDPVEWGTPPIQRDCLGCCHRGRGADAPCTLVDARVWFGIPDGADLPKIVEVDGATACTGNYCPYFDCEYGE